MRQIIDIKVPTCWQQLSDKQLRFVFKLLYGNFSLPQVKALCLLKWARMNKLLEPSIFQSPRGVRDNRARGYI